MNETQLVFVIDTDSYAGNFERELCAYCTGIWDNETHGDEQAELFYQEMGDVYPFNDLVNYVINDDGHLTPQCLIETPKKHGVKDVFSSVGIYFTKRPTEDLINIIESRAFKFAKEGKIFGDPVTFKVLGFRILNKVVHTDKEEV